MLTKRQAELKRKFEFIGKIMMVCLLVMVSLILVETIQDWYSNATPSDCSEPVKDEFGLGVRPNVHGKITFGFGSDQSGFNLLDVFSFED